MAEAIGAAHARHGYSIHLNCHSMPAVSSSHSTDFPGLVHADFVIGDRDGTSASAALSLRICEALRGFGYQVEYNHPYKGVELVRRYGDPAPGPGRGLGMRVPPSPAQLAAIPSWGWLRAGVSPQRSDTVARVARVATRLEETSGMPLHLARRRLVSVPGVGVWTAAETAHRALGDPDAVSFGDYHVAANIGWALTGHPVDDQGLVELLRPYAGHRYRVQRLLELGGHHRPRRGPRMSTPTHLPVRGR